MVMMVHPDKKLAYIPIFKNASSSLTKMFRGWEYAPPEPEYYTFVVVRDPMARFLSTFSRICGHHRILEQGEKLDSLEEIIDGIGKTPLAILDEHLRPQVDYLRTEPCIVDRYFTLENLKATWEEFRGQHKLPPLLHLNEGGKGESYKEVMGRQDVKDVFWDFYDSDLKLWQAAKYREEHPWE